MRAQKAHDYAALIAALVAQAPPLTDGQKDVLRGLLNPQPPVVLPRTCERRPAQAAAAPADPAPQHSAGGS